MHIVDPLAEAYASRFSSPEDPLLAEVHAHTLTNHPHAHMISGHLQGKFLQLFSQMLRPRRILEIGTFTGYSALCLASGLSEESELHTIELRSEDAFTAQGFFNRSKYKEQIKIHIGNAADIIGELGQTWDLVFIDADKTGYIQYFNLVMPQVRSKGFILADNVLFHGGVLEEEIKGKNAKAVHAFNEYVQGQEGVERLMLPFRDGLFLIQKH